MPQRGSGRLAQALGSMETSLRPLFLGFLALAGPPLLLRLYLHLYYTVLAPHGLLRPHSGLGSVCELAVFPGSVLVGAWLLYASLPKRPLLRVLACCIYTVLLLIVMLAMFRLVACFSYGDCM